MLEEYRRTTAARCHVERVRFLAIVSANLDEFVMVRLAELWELANGLEPGETTTAEEAAKQLARRAPRR